MYVTFIFILILILAVVVAIAISKNNNPAPIPRQPDQINYPPLNIDTTLQALDSRSKYLLVTIENRKLDLLPHHNANLRQYAKIHGYTYKFYDQYPSSYAVFWQKLEVMLLELETGNWDYVVWLDSDTYINKVYTSLDVITYQDPNKHIYIGLDCNAPVYCAGFFIVRNSDLGRQFLKDCFANYESNPMCRSSTGELTLNGKWAGPCYEQGVMNTLLRSTYAPALGILDSSVVLNSNNCTREPFVCHFWGDKAAAAACFKSLQKGRPNKFKYLIILTCTVNPPAHINYLSQKHSQDRLRIYKQSHRAWNHYSHPDFQVVVVENSGYVFSEPEPNLLYVNCDTSTLDADDKGQHELLSIQQVLQQVDVDDYDYIIKITGRYFVYDFEPTLRRMIGNRKIQAITQNNSHRCEIVGCRTDLAATIFKYPSSRNRVETEYRHRISELASVCRLPPLAISKTRSGGTNQEVYTL